MCHLTGKSEPVAPSEDECKAVVGEPAPDFAVSYTHLTLPTT